jgi:outer membrane protein
MKSNVIAVLALAVALGSLALQVKGGSVEKRIAFVDSGRLMTGFKEAHKVNGEIKADDDKWKVNLKVMEDSLKSFMDSMTVKYDAADAKGKRAFQDELAARNQQINNYTAAQGRKMEESAHKRMAGIYEKINAYMKEYGKRKGYYLVFGTNNGNIIYGEGTPVDITDAVIEGLNKRYE